MLRLGKVGLDQSAACACQVENYLALGIMLVLVECAHLVLPCPLQRRELGEHLFGSDRRLVLVFLIAADCSRGEHDGSNRQC